jgi:glycosidase
MLYFLENHDEQRLASDFFAGDGRKGIPALAVSLLLGTNPFMLYMGQTLGEKGMDAEGFSGRDGRTTIFDYWSVDTLCRADSHQLTADEERLHSLYQQVLAIARQEKAVGQGAFFDLMYVNGHLYRQYAFLRKAGKELLLVVTNFEDHDVSVDVNIPAHAFDYLKMTKKQKATFVDLLSGQTLTTALLPDGAVHVDIPTRHAVVLKLQ